MRFSWLICWGQSSSSPVQRQRRPGPVRPTVEPLEDRCLLSSTPTHVLFGPPLLGDASDVLQPPRRKAADPRTAQVQTLYRKYLHRRASGGELHKALPSLTNETAVEQLEARLLSSPEYFQKRARKNKTRFLSAAALDVLGHPLGAADVQRYRALLAGGASRLMVANLLLQQREAERMPLPHSAPPLSIPVNRAPDFQPVGPLRVLPGDRLEVHLQAADPDGDHVTYQLPTTSALPTGTFDGGTGLLIFTPTPSQVGTYHFDVTADDGRLEARQTLTLEVAADPVTTTRLAGVLRNTDRQPLAGVPVSVGAVQTTTAADGSFLLDFGGTLPAAGDPLKVRANELAGTVVYPLVAEKLPLLLEHDLYPGVRNVISRPIYLPPLDMAHAMPINPNQDTTVTTAAIPGAALMVQAGTLQDQQGQPFSGLLSITEVPVTLTPAALPADLVPDTVVTIQPGDMVFTQPAPLNLPNRSGWAPGTRMDLWSINPVTGFFDDVGDAVVSADGQVIQTISGGVHNSSWHFMAPQPNNPAVTQDYPLCACCPATEPINSDVNLSSGAVVATHALATYQSLGQSRGVTLRYESLRADPQPVLHIGYTDVSTSIFSVPDALRVVARLAVNVNGVQEVAPGYDQPGNLGLRGGEHFFSVPAGVGPLAAGLPADLRTQPTGVYDYSLQVGVRGFTGSRLVGTSQTLTGQLVNINETDSVFGSGWNIAGLQHLVPGPDNSILLLDGDGTDLLFTAPGVVSTFDTDEEGWQVVGDGTGPTFVASGGNPGGYVTAKDQGFGLTWFWKAPAKFLGNHAAAYGQTLTFDLEQVPTTNPFDDTDVLLAGGGLTLFFDTPNNPGTDWTSYTLPLVETAGWHKGSLTGPAPTRAEMRSVLASLTDLQIRGEFSSNLDTGGLDNVSLGPTPTESGNYVAPPGDFSRLEKLADGSYRRTLPDGTVSLFDTAGRLLSVSDRNGNLTQYHYDTADRLTGITDPVGLATTFAYSGGKVTAITDPAGRVTNLAYDAAGNLARITDPDGAQRQYAYDTDHHLTAETDPRGNRAETFYDAFGRASRAVRADGSVVQVTPGQVGGLYPLTQTTDPASAPAAYRSAAGDAVSIDGNGHATAYTLDSAGQIVDARDAVGSLPQVTRNGANLVTRRTDARGNPSYFTYDDRGNLLTASTPLQTTAGIDLVGTIRDFNAPEHPDFETSPSGYDPGIVQGTLGADGKPVYAGTPNTLTTHGQAAFDQWYHDAPGVNLSKPFTLTLQPVPVSNTIEYRVDDHNFFPIDDDLLGNQGRTHNFHFTYETHTRFTYHGGEMVALASNDDSWLFLNHQLVIDLGGLHVADSVPSVDLDTLGLTVGQTYDFDLFFAERHTSGSELVLHTNLQLDPVPPRRFTYDPTFNQLSSITDELGHQTLFDIDAANGNTLSMTQVIGDVGGSDDLVTHYTYTSHGLIDTTTDPLGRVTDRDYDNLGRLTRITFAKGTPDEAEVGYEYEAGVLTGNVLARIDENGHRTEYGYDAMNRLTRITEADPDGAGPLTSPVTVFTYDRAGNLVTTTDARGNTTTNDYDARNRLMRTTGADPDGAGPLPAPVTGYEYDHADNLTAEVDPLNHRTEHHYDGRNRRIETVDPDQGSTQFDYDLDNNLMQLTDPEGNVTQYAYDARNRLTVETDPLNLETRYTYDDANRLVRKTDRNQRQTEYLYDEVDRLTTETWVVAGQAPANVVTYAYDNAGNILSVVDDFSSLALTYDDRNRVKTVDNNGTPEAPRVVLTYTYDPAGNVRSVSDTINGQAGANTAYNYDPLNRLTQLTQVGAGLSDKRVDFAYNPLGQYAAINRYSDLGGTQLVIGSSFTYDALNRVQTLSHRNAAGQNVAFFNLGYDAAGRIASIADVDGTTAYTYDNRDELTGADHADANNPDESYAYDANGNRTSSHLHGTGYQTDPNTANRLRTDGTFNYEYDAEGSLIRRTEIATGKVREFTWDYRNRLTEVVDRVSFNGTRTQVVRFTYDGFNRRISKAVDTNPNDAVDAAFMYFVYDREDVLLDFADADGAGAGAPVVDKRYLHGPDVDQLLAQEDTAGNVQWLLEDHLGTVHDLVNDTGSVVNHLVYDSFGNVIAETNPLVRSRHSFTSREEDQETGLIYYRARYYNPLLGRFTSEDPVGPWGNVASLYAYAANQPIAFGDPFGLRLPDEFSSHCALEAYFESLKDPAFYKSLLQDVCLKGLKSLAEIFEAIRVARSLEHLRQILSIDTFNIFKKHYDDCYQRIRTPPPRPPTPTPTPEPPCWSFGNFCPGLPPELTEPRPRQR